MAQPAVIELSRLLAGRQFADAMAAVPGYEPDEPGAIVAPETVFPWLAAKPRR